MNDFASVSHRCFQPFLACELALLVLGPSPLGAQTLCVAGMAGPYACQGVDLMANLPIANIGGGNLVNDVWGWTDPLTQREYALVGRSSGTAFVDVTDPVNPIYVGNLPSTFEDTWRDLEVYQDHVFIVQDSGIAINDHGIQIFDLTQLRSVVSPPVTFTYTTRYTGLQTAHTIAIDVESGFAYAMIGSRSANCSGGLHMVDLADPANPVFVGCHSADGPMHDAQCLVYRGPDTAHQGQQICFTANITSGTLGIVDVTDKLNTVTLSRTGYAGEAYIHQGWISDDHRYFLVGDEFDEPNSNHNTRTYIFDIGDLESPVLTGQYTGTLQSRDHNLFIRGRYVYEANYTSGIRILELTDLAAGNLTEVAFFDTRPENNGRAFEGVWSVYPYLSSCIVLASDLERGLFVLRPSTKCVCGDGFVDLAVGEECDDGNTVPGDGCSGQCAVECDPVGLAALRALLAVKVASRDASFSWSASSGTPFYHVTAVPLKTALIDPRQGPTGNGTLECAATPPVADCIDPNAVTDIRSELYYQALSSCGPDGGDEGPW